MASCMASVANSWEGLIIFDLPANGMAFNTPLDNAPPVAHIQSCAFGASLPFFFA